MNNSQINFFNQRNIFNIHIGKTLLCAFTLLLTSCVTINEAALVHQDDTMQAGNIVYSQCDPEKVTTNRSMTNNQGLDPESISLLNWNIYKSNLDNWAEDLRHFIKEQDIITIQEAHLNRELQTILANNQYHWTLNAAFHLEGKPSGVMTASRTTALKTCGLRKIEPIIRTPKTALISYYPIANSNQVLLVANIHSINFTLGTDAYSQQIEQLFQMLKAHNGPIIIAGDFNTWSQTRMSILEQYVQSVNLSSLDYSTHIRTKILGNALDHVFYRGLEPLSHHSWNVDSSDHNPTYVKFRLL